MWRRYDAVFEERSDYRLWRLLFRNLYTSERMSQWPEPLRLAEDALGAGAPAIVWGTLSMLAGVLTRQKGSAFSADALFALANSADKLLQQNPPPLPGAATECTLIKVLALDGVQKIQHKLRAPDVLGAERYISRLTRYLSEVDPVWAPGQAISMERIRAERRSGRVVAPFKVVDLTLRVSYAMYNARGVVRAAAVRHREVPEELLAHGLDFAYGAWRNMRSFRISEEKQALERPGWKSDYDKTRIWHEEMGALLRTAQAARDAGEHLLAARQACLFLWVCPDDLVASERFKGAADQLGFAVRQVGLSIPERFSRPERREGAAARDSLSSAVVYGEPTLRPLEDLAVERGDPFLMRLAREQRSDPLWRRVLTAYPPGADALPRVLQDNKSGNLSDDGVRRAAFLLCLRYSQMHGAARLLEKLPATKEDVLVFARALTETLRVLPFGVDFERPQVWQRILRKQWAALPTAELARLTQNDVFDVHESLLGWGSPMLQQASAEGATMFATRFYGVVSDTEIGECIDSSHRAFAYGSRRITAPDVAAFARRHARAGPDGPLCVSIVALDANRLSVFMATVGRSWAGELSSAQVEAAPSDGESRGAWANAFGTAARRWMRTIGRFADRGPGSVALPACLAVLRHGLRRLVQEYQGEGRWIVLAVDSDLASVPWQVILGTPNARGTVVSVVPSLGWAARPAHDRDVGRVAFTQVLSQAEDLRELAELLRRDKRSLDERFASGAVILGHGSRGNGSQFPEIIAPNGPLQLGHWLWLLGRRITVLHSCHAGHVAPHLLGDCGGIPNLALGLGSRVVCAPVCEVPPAAARVLHEELVRRGSDNTFGERYLAAVARYPAVGLYNLYGFADERLRQHS